MCNFENCTVSTNAKATPKPRLGMLGIEVGTQLPVDWFFLKASYIWIKIYYSLTALKQYLSCSQ